MEHEFALNAYPRHFTDSVISWNG